MYVIVTPMTLSNLSRNPPCPGNKLLAFFISKFLLISEANKSPKIAPIDSNRRKIISVILSIW